MNELEKRAKKHKRKQKYPMSIFPDYKKGAEEFNKNSTPINQDALSSADASSGMAEDIERNKRKGINEEMDDFLYWEIAESQCTGYDCDDNIEYVYGDNENRVWIEQDGRKYKVFVNQVDEKPTATFTSLNKAKAFGEKYWQDNYGYVNESISDNLIDTEYSHTKDIAKDKEYFKNKYEKKGYKNVRVKKVKTDTKGLPMYEIYGDKEVNESLQNDILPEIAGINISSNKFPDIDRTKISDTIKRLANGDEYARTDAIYYRDSGLGGFEEQSNARKSVIAGIKSALRANNISGVRVTTSMEKIGRDLYGYWVTIKPTSKFRVGGRKEVDESLNESNDEDMGYMLGKWLGARFLTGWTAMLNVDGAEESPYYDEYDQLFDGTFVQCLNKLKEYQDIIDRDGVPAYLALQSSHGEYFDGDYDRIIDKLYDRGYLYDDDLEESLNESKEYYNPEFVVVAEYYKDTSDGEMENDEVINIVEYPVSLSDLPKKYGKSIEDGHITDDVSPYLAKAGRDEDISNWEIGYCISSAVYDEMLNDYRRYETETRGTDKHPDYWHTYVYVLRPDAFDSGIKVLQRKLGKMLLPPVGYSSRNEALDEPKRTKISDYDCCGINIDLAELRNRTAENYGILYENDDKIDGGAAGYFSVSSLCGSFDDYMEVNSEFRKLVQTYTKYVGDFLSSDREAAAFIYAVDELYPEIWDAIDSYTVNESLNEDCNSYSYKGKTIINAGDYWFVKGFKEKFPTSDEAEEFIDDKKKDEGVNINIRESLNKMDAESDNTYDLLNLYESKNLSRKQKKDIARMIYENYGLERIYNYLYEATEESEDELPVEDRIKDLTNDFKNTNGSYVFEDVQDANKAVTILKSRGYDASQKRTQDGKYRVTADKKNK